MVSSSPARSWTTAPTLGAEPISRMAGDCTSVASRPANGPLPQRNARGRARVGSCPRHARTTPYFVGGKAGCWRDAPSSPSFATGWSAAMSALGEEGDGCDWCHPHGPSGQTDSSGNAVNGSYTRFYAYGGLRAGDPAALFTAPRGRPTFTEYDRESRDGANGWFVGQINSRHPPIRGHIHVRTDGRQRQRGERQRRARTTPSLLAGRLALDGTPPPLPASRPVGPWPCLLWERRGMGAIGVVHTDHLGSTSG